MATERQNLPTIYGTGLIALDLIISADPSEMIKACTGGTCGNVLTILSYCGWNAYPIARLNGDSASLRVKKDMRRWGVRLDFAECSPNASTPIIVQEIIKDKFGSPKHRFVWSCPQCGNWLPRFKPVTVKGIADVINKMINPQVFFMDRLSRSALILAKQASEQGALVFFEPSSKQDPRLLNEALEIAHIIKYADQRINDIDYFGSRDSGVKLEIQTTGDSGLRYRSNIPNAKTKGWISLSAVLAPKIADTCGAGDWFTAGLIHKVGRWGQKCIQGMKGDDLKEAIRYGQALAAWTCGFEGARGGMYCVDSKEIYRQQIRDIFHGKLTKAVAQKTKKKHFKNTKIGCPACSAI